MPSEEHGIDILMHASIYALVTIFIVLLVERPLMSAIIIFALSGAIKVIQTFVPWRTGSRVNFAANGFGIAVALEVMAVMGAMGFSVTGAKSISEEANARVPE